MATINKNGGGEILFVQAPTKAKFEEALIQDSSLEDSIAFIKQENEIYAGGNYYKGVSDDNLSGYVKKENSEAVIINAPVIGNITSDSFIAVFNDSLKLGVIGAGTTGTELSSINLSKNYKGSVVQLTENAFQIFHLNDNEDNAKAVISGTADLDTQAPEIQLGIFKNNLSNSSITITDNNIKIIGGNSNKVYIGTSSESNRIATINDLNNVKVTLNNIDDANCILKLNNEVSVDWGNRTLQIGADTTLNWNKKQLTNGSIVMLDWGKRILRDGNGNSMTSLDWNRRVLYDSSAIMSIKYGTRELDDSANNLAMNWNNRTLHNSSGIASIDWDNNTLNRSDQGVLKIMVNWDSGILFDYSGENSNNWVTRLLYDSLGYQSIDYNSRELQRYDGEDASTTSIDWQNLKLYNSSITAVLDWQNCYLIDSAGTPSIAWNSRTIADSAGHKSLNYGLRKLYNSQGQESFDWNGTPVNLLSIDWQGHYDSFKDVYNAISAITEMLHSYGMVK